MTQIFKSYTEFVNREDKTANGVSERFADNNPNWEEDNISNQACWNCSDCSRCSDCSYCSRCSDCLRCSYCSRCSDCSYCSGCSDCSYCSRCSDCSRCSGCSDCSYCSRCSGCSDCSDCSYCSGKSGVKELLTIPTLANIHQLVSDAVAKGGALNMGDWHTCDTTHCRAGWVVHLAGESGYALEKATSTEFAAMQIYKASSPIRVSPVRFYEDNEVAMKDIIRCAEEEKQLGVQA